MTNHSHWANLIKLNNSKNYRDVYKLNFQIATKIIPNSIIFVLALYIYIHRSLCSRFTIITTSLVSFTINRARTRDKGWPDRVIN